MKGFVGIKFLLTHGSFLQIVVEENEGKSLVELWRKGALSNEHFGGTNAFGSWAVKISEIIGIHTMPIDVQGSVGPAALRGGGLYGRSGV